MAKPIIGNFVKQKLVDTLNSNMRYDHNSFAKEVVNRGFALIIVSFQIMFYQPSFATFIFELEIFVGFLYSRLQYCLP